ncbi:unnamed protein product [Rotaria sp. Silwood2]|nr:unnamed protein product [Rotaria sp. Silwood2]CAF4082652.1 unnamed protein product [Rotaria sp. Silwood2]
MSLSTQTVIITVSNPSLIVYNDLQVLYSNTLKCPCSTMTIPYNTFISLSPILHQVCSSDLVNNPWLSILKTATNRWASLDWRNIASSQFELLLDLCQLANKTIDDAVRRFILQSFITSNVLTEIDFNSQLNATLNQFFQSTIAYFDLLINTFELFMQVDQPYMGSRQMIYGASDRNIIINTVINETNNQKSLQV